MARDHSLDIAVTGMAGRFPGSVSVDDWWPALLAGRVLTTRYTRQQLLEAGVPEHLADDPDYVPVHGHLAGSDRFDHAFFQISPRDAEMMDPQHRLMLEVAWNALEDAGAAPGSGPSATAVFASSSDSGYLRAMLAGGDLDPATLDQAIHGTEPDFMASRIAYKLGLTGPAMGVRTACSSSLVAVHLAAQSLLDGDCEQALVIGAGIAYPAGGHLHIPGGVLSASGMCRPFDDGADGVVAGSGVGCIVLRRADDALADGPEPYGLILGTAINNDGAAKAGYYAPSEVGQDAVIRAALRNAEVSADSVGYLETHGTGTRVGDPIEWAAASAALGRLGAGPGQIAVGALKANVGHLDAAAGVAALMKALLVVRHGTIPPVAGFTSPNELLDRADSPLFVPTEARGFGTAGSRRAGVSAFGIGGTNAHVVIEQTPVSARPEPDHSGGERLVLLSAGDPDTLARSATRLADRVRGTDLEIADVSFTLAAGRTELPERLAVSGKDTAELADRLENGVGVVRGSVPAGGAAPVAFLFPGQGTQYPGMALPLVEALPGFDAELETCLAYFPADVAARIRAGLLDPDFPGSELDETALAQPAMFALEYAAAVTLVGLGLRPTVLAGHSLGEITAACLAGAIGPADAAALVTARGQAMQLCAPGAMLALSRSAAGTEKLLQEWDGSVELAAINASDRCVVAGSFDEVRAFQDWCGEPTARMLRTNRAFHSRLIESALPRLTQQLADIEPRRLMLPLVLNTGAELAAGEVMTRAQFVDQARDPVRFADAASALARSHPGVIAVEVGPGHTLTALADGDGLTTIPLSPGRATTAGAEVRAALGELWTRGQPLQPLALSGSGGFVHLPGQAFAGPRWIAPEAVPAPLRGLSTPVGAARPEVGATPAESVVVEVSGAADLVRRVWGEVLGSTEMTDESDFFELGGDSLLATHFARRLGKELHVRVPLREILVGRTLGRQIRMVLDLLEQDQPATVR